MARSIVRGISSVSVQKHLPPGTIALCPRLAPALLTAASVLRHHSPSLPLLDFMPAWKRVDCLDGQFRCSTSLEIPREIVLGFVSEGRAVT